MILTLVVMAVLCCGQFTLAIDVQPNTRFYASTFQKVKNINENACLSLCESSEECTGMSYKADSRKCFIFKGIFFVADDEGYVSWFNTQHYLLRGICLEGDHSIDSDDVRSPAGCRAKCAKDPNCKGSTFNQECQTFTDIQGATKAYECVSWTRGSDRAMNGICLNNANVQPISKNSVRECIAACRDDSKCRTISYRAQSHQCSKHSRDYTVSVSPQCQAYVPYPLIHLQRGRCLSNAYKTSTKENLIDCYEECGRDPSRCVGMTYNTESEKCEFFERGFKEGDQNEHCRTWVWSKL